MFVDAIKKVSEFTRPIHIITKEYGGDFAIPGAATMFFVNELGVAITCKHVVATIVQTEVVNEHYAKFKNERSALSKNKYNRKLKELEQKYQYSKNITVQIKNNFMSCVDKFDSFEIIAHPIYDLAIIKFNGFTDLSYKDHTVF